MSHVGGGSEKCQKSVTYYLNVLTTLYYNETISWYNKVYPIEFNSPSEWPFQIRRIEV